MKLGLVCQSSTPPPPGVATSTVPFAAADGDEEWTPLPPSVRSAISPPPPASETRAVARGPAKARKPRPTGRPRAA